jgi:hypothetical protein
LFVLEPKPGKRLYIEMVEVQFSVDVVLMDTVYFQPFGYVKDFAPQLVNNVNPDYVTTFPGLFQIPLGYPKAYKTMHDYINEATRAYSKYPAMGGSGWRGVQNETVVFNWDYLQAITLDSSKGMKIHIYLKNDIPFTGEYATATIYGFSETI